MALRFWAPILTVVLVGCGSSDVVATTSASLLTTASFSSSTTDPPTTTPSAPSSTTTTTTAPTTTTTDSSTELEGLVLRGDGLGVVSLGGPMDAVIATLSEVLGEPSSDLILEAPFGDQGELGGGQMACWTATGTTCIDFLRIVEWGNVGLTILISDWTVARTGEDYYDRELQQTAPNLRGYSYTGGDRGATLVTAQGITIGSTIDQLSNAYGEQLFLSDDECSFDIAGFQVVVDAEGLIGLWGELSAVPDSPDAVVRSIGAGSLQGNC